MIARELAGLPWQSLILDHHCDEYKYTTIWYHTIRLNDPNMYSTGIAQRVWK